MAFGNLLSSFVDAATKAAEQATSRAARTGVATAYAPLPTGARPPKPGPDYVWDEETSQWVLPGPEDPFTAGIAQDLLARARIGTGAQLQPAYRFEAMPGSLPELQAQERADLMTAQEQILVAEQPQTEFGAEIDRIAPAGSPRDVGLDTGAIRGDFSSVAEGITDPEAAALLGAGLVGPSLAGALGIGARSAAGFAAPRVAQEVLGLEQMPGQELGQVLRESVPGAPGRILGRGAEFALDPTTLAGFGITGRGLLPNLLGRGNVSAARFAAEEVGSGLGFGAAEELGLPPLAGAVLGGAIAGNPRAALAFADTIRRGGQALGSAAADRARQVGDAAFRQGTSPTPNVVRVAVSPGAVRPVAEEGLAASRGAVQVVDPAGVRILGEGEFPEPGESLMFHGTAGELRGDALDVDTFLTPNRVDAEVFAGAASREATQQPGFVRQFLADESGAIRLRKPEDPTQALARQLRETDTPEAFIDQIRNLDLTQKLELSLAVGKGDRHRLLEFQGLLAQAEAGDLAAAQQLRSRWFRDNAVLTKRATQLTNALETLKRVNADETGAIRLGRDLTADTIERSETALGRPLTPDERAYIQSLPRDRLRALRDQIPTPTGQMAFDVDGFGLPPQSTLAKIKDNLAALPSALKYVQTSGDIFGFQFRQGLPAAFIDPKAWGRNFERIGRAYLEDPQARAAMQAVQEIRRFSDGDLLDIVDPSTGKKIVIRAWSEVMEAGFQTPGMEKINDALITRAAEKMIPLAARSEKALRVGYLGLSAELRNGMIDDAIRAGINNQAWFDHYDDIAKVAVGYGDVPDLLKGISNGFYSLRNLAARFQMATQPVTKPGPVFRAPLEMLRDRAIFSASPRGVATRNLTRFAAGEIANLQLLAFAGRHSGLFEVGWNPLEAGFGVLQFEDQNGNTIAIDLMGGYGSMVKMLARTAAAARGDDPFNTAFVEQVKFWRYKAAPGPSIVIDALVKATELSKLEAFDSPFAKSITDPDTWTSGAFLEWVTPFFAGEMVQAVLGGALDVREPEDLLEAAGFLLSSWGLGNVSLYEQSAYGALSRARMTALLELQREGVIPQELYPIGTEYSDLGPGARDLVNARVRETDPNVIRNAEAARRDSQDIFQLTADQARLNQAGRGAKLDPKTGEVVGGDYVRLLGYAMNGIETGATDIIEARAIMENARSLYDKSKAAQAAAYNTPEYEAAIKGLPETNINVQFAAWYDVYYQSEDPRTGLIDYDLVDRKHQELLEEWQAQDPASVNRFLFELANRETDLPPIIQLDRDLKASLRDSGYYDLDDEGQDAWWIEHPQEAAMSWLLGGRKLPTIEAMQEALNLQSIGLGAGRTDIVLKGFGYPVSTPEELATFAELYDRTAPYFELEGSKRGPFLDKNPEMVALLVFLGYDIAMTEKRIAAGADRALDRLEATYGRR